MKYTSREDLNMCTARISTDQEVYGDTLFDAVGVMVSYKRITADVVAEVVRATHSFPAMASAHEGFAILKEEVDELWDAVRIKQSDPDRINQMRAEAIQVAAMALRFLHDVSGDA